MHFSAHNGGFDGIWEQMSLKSGTFHPVGDTDSEYAFCVLLERLALLWRRTVVPPPLPDRLSIVAEMAGELRQLGPANFLYSDGDVLFAHAHARHWDEGGGRFSEPRPPGLSPASRRDLSVKGLHVEARHSDALYVASVPLTAEGWTPLREGTVLALRKGHEEARIAP